jgi:uncharacterized membrane protein HdeD (DUF308 family)
MSLTKPQQENTTPWWLVLIEGIALIIIGILLLTNTGKTTLFIAQVMAIYWIISGILQLINMFRDHTAWGWKLFAGVIGIFAGIVLLGQPIWATLIVLTTAIIILGIQGIIYGGIGLYQAFKGAGWGAGILAVLSIIFGIILLANIWVAAFSLPWVIGVFAIIGGILAIIAAFRFR